MVILPRQKQRHVLFHFPDRLQCCQHILGLLLIEAAHRKAHVNQYPTPQHRFFGFTLPANQCDIHFALHAADVGPGVLRLVLIQRHDLPGDPYAHSCRSSQANH
ncbi:hypothetical protein D3C72_2011260 [compost metagenome]